MLCDKCVKVKDKPLAYKKCTRCEGYAPLSPTELSKIARRPKK